MKHKFEFIRLLTAALFFAAGLSGPATCQLPQAAKAELGSRTAKAGFANETEIAAKFDNWRSDADARDWLTAMGYDVAKIISVAAMKPHGEKADVQVRVKTNKGESVEGISIKLVSNPNGFNQLDKRWLASYAEKWRMPRNVVRSMELFLGERKPDRPSRSSDRLFLNEIEMGSQRDVIDFFARKREEILSDIFEGDGPFAAKWFMVALKSAVKPRWILVTSAEASKFFGEGPVMITRNGNLKIGRITMQRKGGDAGRETAKMLQFKINPALLFEAK